MYTEKVNSQSVALCHLFFHCSMKDEQFTESEIDNVSSKIVELGLQSGVNIREEFDAYKSYKNQIEDETEYLQHLFRLINPVNDLAMYSYCLEILLSDSSFTGGEEDLMSSIGRILEITDQEQQTLKKLVAQRKVVEEENIC